ncbi:MAG: cell envelope-related transcriptional attenuator [Symbiobacteriaceae bacterium]|nr:cell envelope-related transcriptional attenuator [Symbiobacteriaceae bacterium]
MVSHSDLLGARSSRRKPPRRWGRLIVLLLAGSITAALVYTFSMVGVAVQEVTDPISAEVRPEMRPLPVQAGQRINVLVMGLDADKLRSDMMMLVSIDPETKKAALMQIPRDTRALIAGRGSYEKINSAYAYGVGDKQFPANLRALKTVEDLLDVAIHYTVVIDLEGFRKAIDAAGGVTIDIPQKMDYDDPTQDLHIHFEPGRQELDGKQALEYVRWRGNNDGTGYVDGDLGRIRAQQQFLGALLDQMLRPSNLVSLPGQLAEISHYISTTMESGRVLSLTALGTSLRRQDLEFTTLPGTDGYLFEPAYAQRISYYFMDPVATEKLVNRAIRGIDPKAAANVKVQVAAGASPAAAAQALVERFVGQGFAASLATAAEAGAEKTRVVALTGDAAKAQLVARSLASLGHTVEVMSLEEPNPTADVRVILGKARSGN